MTNKYDDIGDFDGTVPTATAEDGKERWQSYFTNSLVG